MRVLVEDGLHGLGDFGDYLSFLFLGNAIAGDTNADERHAKISSSSPIEVIGGKWSGL
jgi:hypothetical protein